MKRRKPEFENDEDEKKWYYLNSIANHATKSEKTSWIRKRNNIEKMIESIRPLEEEILSIRAKIDPIHDKIEMLRVQMVDDCIHPFDLLEDKGDHVLCKFCECKLSIPKRLKDD